jgi:hypothetical protein
MTKTPEEYTNLLTQIKVAVLMLSYHKEEIEKMVAEFNRYESIGYIFSAPISYSKDLKDINKMKPTFKKILELIEIYKEAFNLEKFQIKIEEKTHAD